MEELFRELYGPVLGFFSQRGCSQEECRDLAQETFLRAHRAFDSFRGEAKRSTWLFTIAANVWLNQRRAKDTAKRSADEVPLPEVEHAPRDPEVHPLDDAIREEKLELLQAAIADLPPKMQRCVRLRVYQDMKYREIAELVGISIETAKSQLSLARKRLRSALAEHYPDLDADLKRLGD
ncbi:MAG: RNA polymerase sigma factor [Acidobacteriota bacterium]